MPISSGAVSFNVVSHNIYIKVLQYWNLLNYAPKSMHTHSRGLDQQFVANVASVLEPSTVITVLTGNHRIFPSLSDVYGYFNRNFKRNAV